MAAVRGPGRKTRRRTRFRVGQEGVLSLFMASAIIVILGLVGLAVDTGRMLTARTELQSAVDACALSAALELNGLPDATQRAFSAGAFVGGKNLTDFQGRAIALQADNVQFSAALAGPYFTAAGISPATAQYVRCTANLPGMVAYFLKVLGINSANLRASATAAVAPSQSVCALPMAMFEGLNVGTDPANFDHVPGDIVTIAGSNTGRGFFTWADVLNASTVNTLAPYKQALTQYGSCGALTAPGRCIGIKTGEVASLVEEWNTRFGLYKSYTPLTAIPDLSGYGYDPATSRDTTILGNYTTVQAPARTPYQSSVSSYSIPLNVNRDYGAPYRRLTAIPVVRDSASCGSDSKMLVGWACVLLMKPVSTANADPAKVLFISRADAATSPCRASGTAGGAGAIGPLVPVIVQ